MVPGCSINDGPHGSTFFPVNSSKFLQRWPSNLWKGLSYLHKWIHYFFNQNCFSLVFCQWMCAGLSASRPNPSYSHIEGEIWRRVWGGSPALQVDGLLFQRSSFVCGKGSHDWICQTTYSGTGSELQPQRTHIKVLTLLELLENIDISC